MTDTTESTPKPLDEIVIDFLLSQKRETSEIDFKLTLDISRNSDFAKIAKDIFAMSNYGGGYLIIGYREKETGGYEPVGLPLNFHIESASLQEKFDAYSNAPLPLDYIEIEKDINGEKKKFAILYIPPSPVILKPIKYATCVDTKLNKEKKLFSKDEILIRRGTKNDHATLNEIKFIEKRCQDTGYRISLLSGEPDNIIEELFGNYFKVSKIPEFIFEADVPKNIRFSFNETRNTPYFRPRNSGKIYSFSNLAEETFGKYIIADSLRQSRTVSYFQSEAKRNFLVKLLNIEIQHSALKKRLKYAGKNKNVFYFTTIENELYVEWESTYRKSKKRVAYKTKAPDTDEDIFIHDGASIRFQFINDDIYLSILPTVVTTYDGFNIIKGPDGGPAKTHYSYRKFNDSFLKLILFWIYKFKGVGEKTIIVNNKIEILPEPVALDINIGIRQDRPAEEFHDRENELYDFQILKDKSNRFYASYIVEPDLIFGNQREEKDPKIGLKKWGPYYTTSEKGPSPNDIRIGIVGTGVTITSTKRIIELFQKEYKSEESNRWLYPDFPGFRIGTEVNCQFTNSDNWNETINTNEINEVLAIKDANERIAKATDLFTDKIKNILEEDSPPQVVICAIPLCIEKSCGISEETRDAKTIIPNTKSKEKNKQHFLEEWLNNNELERESEDSEEETTQKSYDFRNALKGKAMKFDVPTQILKESTARSILEYPSSNFEAKQTPSAFCWNLSTALYYKANGRPWRLAKLTAGTCYVGVAFYQNKRDTNLNLEISLAQVFTHSGEGFVLRGHDVKVDKETREAHLTEGQARDLLKDALEKYIIKVNAKPNRVVVYKTSFFSEEEKKGFDDAIGNLKKDYVSVSKKTNLRFLRTGKYPVLRGTIASLAPNQCLLYTSGYTPRIRTYPGHRVPKPLLLNHDGDSELDFVCKEILGLTKLNWNTTTFSKQLPITIEFAQSVGKILSELPREITSLKDHYKFYM
jgi:hypothetical protein